MSDTASKDDDAKETTSETRFTQLDQQVSDKLQSLITDGLCTASDLDDKVVQQLRLLAPVDAVDAIDKLQRAAKDGTVRNISAYLAGVIRRIAQLPAGASGPEELVPPAAAILEQLYKVGALKRGDLDHKPLRTLAGKSPELQVLIMQTFRDRNLHGIRNMAAFFTSHCSQVERDLRDGKLRLPRLDGGGRHPSYPPSRHPNHWHSHSGPSPQGPGRYGPPRFSRYEPSYMRPGGEGPGQEPRGLRPSDAYPGPQAARYDPESVPRSMSHGQSALQQGLSHQPALIGGHGPAATIPSSLLPGSGVQPTTAATAIGSTASRVMTSSSIAASSPPPKHYGVEQVQWGVRVDEFQSLSPFSKYVHPAAALHLQQLWDSESNKLVSVLNETSWEQLAGLDAASSVTAINEVVEAMKTAPDDIGTINALFLRTAAKFPKRPDAPTAASIAGVSGASGAVPLGAPAPAGGYATGTSAQPPTAVAQPQSGMASMYATPQVPSTYPQPSAGSLQQPEIHNRYPPTEPQIRLPGPCGDLSPALQAAIDRLLGQWGGLLKLDHFDDRVVDALSRMREPVAVHALEEFGHNDPTQMRNPTAYLLGCLRKYERRSASEFPPNGSGMEGGRGRGGRGRGRGGRGRVATPRYEPY